ncbi:MAG: KUP/HAK/KT family potassium transporter [Pyrinomonadaceae bacterium]|nr:KUP/HAK/KT family potassium transporter [Pyrinomonadaceae bacterium]
MEHGNHQQNIDKVTFAGLLVALGIVFGDIGTSPLYVFSAIIGTRKVEPMLVLGGFSAVFWTLMFQTTIKYVLIALRADNNGEGGIFSLFALVRRYAGSWLMYVAIIGGSFLLADGIITPPISVSSAIEGLRIYSPEIPTVPIVITILIGLFVVQQFGTQFIGKFFGPIMTLWFTFIGVIGLMSLTSDFSVLKALNPYYAYQLLTQYPHGFWLLGAVFLCTTGAEALYSDMGHCGRGNIRISWIYVKICLLLNYAGQSAFLMSKAGNELTGATPFYSIVPSVILPLGITIATLAAIIASQALISGSFTLIGEAIRLNFWSRQRIFYPTDFKGQLYIPQVNWLLMAGCIFVVLYFHESKYMEAAYGLSVTLTMLMTTFLLFVYMRSRRFNAALTYGLTLLFLAIELSFLTANLEKFPEGGYVSVLVGFLLFGIMWIWFNGRKLRRKLLVWEKTENFFGTLKELSNDKTIPQYATHLVYLTASDSPKKLERETIESILEKTPKRADVYWFVHVKTDDHPFTTKYKVETIAKEDVYFITFTLGFRIEPRISYLFELVLEELVKNKEVERTSRHPALKQYNIHGDIRFVLLSSFLSYENDLSGTDNFIMRSYYILRRWFSIREDAAYGLDADSVVIENVPVVVARPEKIQLERVE